MKPLGDGVVAHLQEIVAAPDLTGTPYRFVRTIGRGGMATVHLVDDARLGRRVALKVLDAPGDPDLARRLTNEARVIARLEHPSIVPVHDVGRLADGRAYYAMKFVRGERLDVVQAGSRARREVLRLFQRVGEAVAFAHAAGVVHRDLKPQNILIGAFGEALVMDWGLARALPSPRGAASPDVTSPDSAPPDTRSPDSAPLDTRSPGGDAAIADTLPAPLDGDTRAGAILGTPGYMAPEQVRGEIDRIDQRTDVFALGAILHFLLAGRPPFSGATAEEVLSATLHAEPPDLRSIARDVPRPLASICRRALRKEPGERYASASELSADVAAFLDGLPVSAHRETAPEMLARWYGRYQALILLLAAYVIMRAVVALVARR